VILTSCVLLTIASGTVFGQAEESASLSNLRDKVDQEVAAYASQNFHPAAMLWARASKSRPARFAVRLLAGAHYALLAACDADCGGIELSLLDDRGTTLMHRAEQQPLTLMNGVPQVTALNEVVVAVPGCRERLCHVRLSILREGDGDDVAAIVAPSGLAQARTGQRNASTAMTVVAQMRIDRTGYAARSVSFYPQCELLCLLEDRCAALAFRQETRTCDLHDEAHPTTADVNTIMAIKKSGGTP
jgi:hypothetical protein